MMGDSLLFGARLVNQQVVPYHLTNGHQSSFTGSSQYSYSSSFLYPDSVIFPAHDNYAIFAPSGRSGSMVSSSSRSTSSSNRSSAQCSPETRTDEDCPIGYGAFGVVWAVTDPRHNKRVALKKIANVFHSLVSCRRVYRELTMLCEIKHDNVLTASDVVVSKVDGNELYVVTELMQSDLHKIIISSQVLTNEHIKLFMYQILRGLKFLHSANIIHRDIKPGNLLVNGDCRLKICDFGLARVYETDEKFRMTQEVVTQYYRAPEILMGAKHYTQSVDIWSVGCIFAELLSRHVLFQANSALQQLDLIINILGTPSLEDMVGACEPAKLHILRQPFHHPNILLLRNLSPDVDSEILHLLLSMLSINSKRRLTATEALLHPYLEDGRQRYHTCMCMCCQMVPPFGVQSYTQLEPVCHRPFSPVFEDELSSVSVVRNKLQKLLRMVQMRNEAAGIPQLHLNQSSPMYKIFVKSQCAQISELPPSPHQWE